MRHIYFYNVHGCLYGSGLFAYISQNGKWTLGLYVVRRKKAITFLSLILAKCVCDESCRGNSLPNFPKGLVLVAPIDFSVYR